MPSIRHAITRFTLFAAIALPAISVSPIARSAAPGSEGLSLQSSDWPWWRGAQRDGIVEGQSLPLRWSETENIVWKSPIPGRGHGSPIIVGDRVLLATADEEKQSQHVLCLDRATGKELWNSQIHKGGWQGRIHDRNTQASSTLASDGERVFTVFMHDAKIWITALDLNGNTLWQDLASDFASHWGYSTSPVIYDDLVIVASDHKEGGNLTAYDRKTGNRAWNVSRPAIPNYATPVVYNIDGKDQLLVPGCDLICSYDPKTGIEIWSIEATTRETIGSMVRNGNLLYASGGYPKHETVCITASDSPEIVWISPIRVYAPSLLAHDGYLYAVTDNGLAHCWDGKNGALKWREKVGGSYSASPVLVDGRIYVSSEQGETIVLNAKPDKFELLAENQLGNEIWASPVVSDNHLFLRVAHTEGEKRSEAIYCIGE